MATTNPIILPIKTPGLSDLQKLEKRMEALERDANKVNRTLPKTSNAIRQTGRAAGTATGNIQRMGIAFRSTIAPIVAAYGAINFFGSALGTLSTREADLAVLTNGLQKLGGTEADLAKLQKQADKFGNTTLFNQEDFTAGAGLLTSFTDVAVKDYQRVIDISSDLAQTNKGAVKDSLLQVAKALNAPSQNLTALSRSGIQFTESQKAVIKALEESGNKAAAQSLILKELEKQYGGNAKAAATGYAGAVDTLGETFRDFQEVMAQGVLPVVEEFVKEATKVFKVLSTLDPKLITTATKAATFAAKVAGVVLALKGLIALKAGITGMLAAAAGGMAATGNASVVAAGKVNVLAASFLRLLPLMAAVAAYDYLGNAAKAGGNLEAETAKLEAGGSAAFFGGASRETVLNAKDTARQAIKAINNELTQLKQPDWKLNVPVLGPALAGQKGARAQLLQARKANAQSILNLDPDKFKSDASVIEAEATKLAALLKDLGISGGAKTSKAKGGKSSAADKSAKEAEELLKQQTSAGDELEKQLRRRIKLIQTEGEFDKANLQIAFDYQDQVAEIIKTAAPLQREGLITQAAAYKDLQEVENLKDAIEGLAGDVTDDYVKALDESNKELTQNEKLLKGAYEIVSGELTNSIKGLIDGTKEWGDVLSDILGSLGSMFLNAGFNSLGAGLKIPGYADGGRPPMGQVSVVGERGPELFVPDTAGTVLPNDAFAAAANALSSGGSGGVEGAGSDDMAAAFSTATSAMQINNNNRSTVQTRQLEAAQAEQMNNPTPIKVDYGSTVINSVEYVTASEFQKGLSATANKARSQTLKDLRNKPSSRARAGVS